MAEENKLAELYVEVKAKTDKLEKDLNRLKTKTAQTTKSMSNSFAGLKGAMAGIGITVGFAALLGAFKTAIKLAGEQERVEKQLEQVIRSTGGAAGYTAEELKKMASNLQKVTTFGDEAIIPAQSLLLTFTKIGRDVFPKALEAVLDMSYAMGNDLKSTSIQVGKALNDPIKGISALSKVGVSFTEDQKKLVKSLVDTGRVMDAQQLILNELAVEFGGSARNAVNSFSGKIDQLKNNAGDFAEKVGFAVIPTLEKLSKQLDKVATSGQNASGVFIAIEKVAQFVGNVIMNGVNMMKLLWTGLIDFARFSYATVTGDFKKAAEIAEQGLKDLGTNASEWGKGAVRTFTDIFKASEQTQKSLQKFAEFDFASGKIGPVQKRGTFDAGNRPDDGEAKELSFVEQILQKRIDIETNIKAINAALESTKLNEQQINDLLLERFNLLVQLGEINKRNPFEPDLPEIDDELEGEDKILPDFVGKATGAKDPKDMFGPAKEDVDNMAQQFGSIINAATTIGDILGFAADSFVGKLIQGFNTVTQMANSVLGIISAFSGGVGGGIFSLFGHKGGVFEGGQQVAKFAGGGDFTVPAGFSNDSFPMMVESGERVKVTPSGRVGDESKLLAELVGVGKATNKSIAVMTSRIDSLELKVDIDGKHLVKQVTKPIENKLKKVGYNVDAL